MGSEEWGVLEWVHISAGDEELQILEVDGDAGGIAVQMHLMILSCVL